MISLGLGLCVAAKNRPSTPGRRSSIEPPQTGVPQSLNIIAISSASLQPSPVLQTDRQCFISYLSSKATFLTQTISVVLSAPDVDWRRLIFEAACSKGLHEWMVKVSWLLPGTRAEWNDLSNASLTEEVDSFLAGMIGQKSWLSRETLVDAIEIYSNPSKSNTSSSAPLGQPSSLMASI